MSDRVNHPSHYNTDVPYVMVNAPATSVEREVYVKVPIECIDVIRDMPLWKGNAIKYLWRAGLKKSAALSDKDKEIEDLQKAMWYIQDRIDQLKKA